MNRTEIKQRFENVKTVAQYNEVREQIQTELMALKNDTVEVYLSDGNPIVIPAWVVDMAQLDASGIITEVLKVKSIS
jgi:hypothetical protein